MRVSPAPAKRIVVLLSGSGTNLQAILEASQQPDFGGRVVAVISNRPGAAGLERARKAGVSAETLDHRRFDRRETFDEALRTLIDGFHPDLVVLAGFMRILTDAFVAHYRGRLLNIHPSLLPRFPGLETHRRALQAGDPSHGATVHFVTEELDGGPPVIQVSLPVEPGDTPETLAARVLTQEHRIYPVAIQWFCQGRLTLSAQGPMLDGALLEGPVQWSMDTAGGAAPAAEEDGIDP